MEPVLGADDVLEEPRDGIGGEEVHAGLAEVVVAQAQAVTLEDAGHGVDEVEPGPGGLVAEQCVQLGRETRQEAVLAGGEEGARAPALVQRDRVRDDEHGHVREPLADRRVRGPDLAGDLGQS